MPRKRWIIPALGCLAFLALIAWSSKNHKDEESPSSNPFRQMHASFDAAIEKADEAWISGDRGKAVEMYRDGVYSTIPLRPQHPDIARGLERMIDFKIAHGARAEALGDIEFAAKSNIPLTLPDSEARQSYAQFHAHHQQRTNQFLAKGRRQLAIRSGSTPQNINGNADIAQLTQVRSGMSYAEVASILGQPHKVDTDSVPALPELRRKSRSFETWTYNPDKENFIVLTFEDGTLIGGGSGGYDVKKGLGRSR